MDLNKIKDKNYLKKIQILLKILNFKTTSSITLSLFILLNCTGSSKSNIINSDSNISYQIIEDEKINKREVNKIVFKHNNCVLFENNLESDAFVVEEPVEIDKFSAVMDEYNLTYEQLDLVIAGCVAEACVEGNNYDDAYAVANTLYNRINSITWVDYISSIMGSERGYSLYYQFIAPGQFEVYETGAYKKYLDQKDLIGYQAVIDMFYSKVVMNNYLSFRSNNTNLSISYETFASNGNKYFNTLTVADNIENKLILSKNN